MTSKASDLILQILAKYPDRVPAYVNFPSEYKHMKNKYLIPREYTMGEFIAYMRKKMSVPAKYGLIVIVNQTTIPTMSQTIDVIYSQNKDPNGMLQVIINMESTFG